MTSNKGAEHTERVPRRFLDRTTLPPIPFGSLAISVTETLSHWSGNQAVSRGNGAERW